MNTEVGGYVCALASHEGDALRAGETLCYISGTKDWLPPTQETVASSLESLPGKLRITKPALALAQANNLDLEGLPSDGLITEKAVQEILAARGQPHQLSIAGGFDADDILVYGGGGHGKSLIELIQALGRYHVAAVVDDGKQPGEKILDVPVVGGSLALPELHRRGLRLAANAVGGIGDIRSRIAVFERLQETGFDCPSLVHPSAVVEPSAQMADGVQVFPLAYVGSQARLGFGVIVNTGAIVSHDCSLGDYTNVSPGAMLAGEVLAGERVLIGMGATINLQVRIGAGAHIGNGATVKGLVPTNAIVHAGGIWPE